MGKCVYCGKGAGLFSSAHEKCTRKHYNDIEAIINKVGEIENLIENIKHIIEHDFLVEPCSRCNENEMLLESISPKGKSIKYSCCNCNKNNHAPANVKSSENLIVDNWNTILELEIEISSDIYEENTEEICSLLICGYAPTKKYPFNSRVYNEIDTTIRFTTLESVMPYDQTKREYINEKVRSEVWRRDHGKCAICDSKNNLQFDHIIPISKGGATTATNLQLLCRTCNQKKSNKI